MANATESTQWVCTTMPTCLCDPTNESPFDCVCPDVVDGACSECKGPMHEINIDNGEPVAAAAGG